MRPLKRLQPAYYTFIIISMVLSSLSLFMMRLDDRRGEHSPGATDLSADLLTSTAINGVATTLITVMLSFHFEGCEDEPGKFDCAIAWLPVVLIDLVIIGFLAGLVSWHNARRGSLAAVIMRCQLGAMIGLSSFVAVHLWRTMRQLGSHRKGEQKGPVAAAGHDGVGK